jgi:hypothetical protein
MVYRERFQLDLPPSDIKSRLSTVGYYFIGASSILDSRLNPNLPRDRYGLVVSEEIGLFCTTPEFSSPVAFLCSDKILLVNHDTPSNPLHHQRIKRILCSEGEVQN